MKISKNSFLIIYSCLFIFSCQSNKVTDTSKNTASDSNQGKSRHELIKEEKRKQSEADLPFRGLDTSKKISTIAFGSSADQALSQPLWGTIAKQNPDLFLFIGDPISISKPEQKNISEQYKKLNRIPEYRDIREKVPFLTVWDSDGQFLDKETSKSEFIKYWNYLKTTLPKQQKAFYHSKQIGAKKQTVQVIMLDTRWDRSELKRNAVEQKNLATTASTDVTASSTDQTAALNQLPEPGPYLIDDDKKKHFLSEEQWSWLENELRKPASLRFLVSSIQVIANDHQFEKWGNFPHERERLLNLIKSTKAKNLVILSGNRKLGAIAQTEIKSLGKIYDITTGPINQIAQSNMILKDSAYLKDANPAVNFGLIKINWDSRKATIEIKGLDDSLLDSIEFKF